MPGGLPQPLTPLQQHQPFPGSGAREGGARLRQSGAHAGPASPAHLPPVAADSLKQNLQMSGSPGGGDFRRH